MVEVMIGDYCGRNGVTMGTLFDEGVRTPPCRS
jgi:hypothetical protein